MHTLPAPLTQALDRLDHLIDCSAAVAALIYSENDLDHRDRNRLARLLLMIGQSIEATDNNHAPDCIGQEGVDRASQRGHLVMCLNALGMMMSPDRALDAHARNEIVVLLDQLCTWQRAALRDYAAAVGAALPVAAPVPVAKPAAPRRRKRDQIAA